MGLTKPKPHSNRRRRGSLSPPRFASACLAASAFCGIREAFFVSPPPPPAFLTPVAGSPGGFPAAPVALSIARESDANKERSRRHGDAPPFKREGQARASPEKAPGSIGCGWGRGKDGAKKVKEEGKGRREWPAQGKGKSGEGRPPNPIGPAAGLAQSAKAFKMKADKTPFSPIGANPGAAKRPAPAVGGRQSQ